MQCRGSISTRVGPLPPRSHRVETAPGRTRNFDSSFVINGKASSASTSINATAHGPRPTSPCRDAKPAARGRAGGIVVGSKQHPPQLRHRLPWQWQTAGIAQRPARPGMRRGWRGSWPQFCRRCVIAPLAQGHPPAPPPPGEQAAASGDEARQASASDGAGYAVKLQIEHRASTSSPSFTLEIEENAVGGKRGVSGTHTSGSSCRIQRDGEDARVREFGILCRCILFANCARAQR
jgi:hypothetical protein